MGTLGARLGSRNRVNQQLWVRSLLATLLAASVGVSCSDDDEPGGGEAGRAGQASGGTPAASGAAGSAGLGGVNEGGGGTGAGALGGEAGQGGTAEIPRGGAGGEGGDEPAITPPRLLCPGEGGAGGAQGGAGGSDNDSDYTRTDLGENTSAVAINALDQVLVNVNAGSGGFCHPYVIDGDTVTPIVVPGRPQCTRGIDLSDVGTVVGTAQFAGEQKPRAFLWKKGQATMLPVAEHGQPFMINNLEQVLLQGDHGSVLWDGDVVPVQVQGAPASPFFINNAGHVLAWASTDDSWLIKGAQTNKVPFDSAEPLQALSDTGLVVGIHDQVVAIWDGATVTKLDVVTEGNPGQMTDEEDDDGKVVVHAINGLGAFVGDYPYADGEATLPFVFANGRTTRLAAGGSALDINPSGVVVGNRWINVWTGGLHGGYMETQKRGAIWSRGCFSSCCASE